MSKKKRRNRGKNPQPPEVPLQKVDRSPCDYNKHSLHTFMSNLQKVVSEYQPGESFHNFNARMIEKYKGIPFYDEATFDFMLLLGQSFRKATLAWLGLSSQFNYKPVGATYDITKSGITKSEADGGDDK